MQPGERKIWFPAKRYGWGWGPPVCWQGWVVVLLWAGLNAGGAFWLMHRSVHAVIYAAGSNTPLRSVDMQGVELYVIYAVVLTLLFCAICLAKGEKPRWRWGGE